MLLGYQVIQRALINPVIEAVEGFVEDRDELVRTVEAVLAHLLMQGNGAAQAALRTHATARDAWMRGRGAGLSKRLDAVLDRVITDAQAAERALNYAISGNHVAFIAWLDDPERPLELADAERRVARMQGVRDALLVPRDERTLYGWLHTPDGTRIHEWMDVAREVEESRIAFGEVAEGLEGFRLSHLQAKSTGAVIAASRSREHTTVVRYKDVAALSFVVERQSESKGWAQQVLGGLAETGEDRERLRETLRVFLDEGENAIVTGEKLFIHRNTVKYRVDRALSLLPEPLGNQRLDVALALRYIDWVGVSD
jgi:DNA-binding PucR family transcriptional regulator